MCMQGFDSGPLGVAIKIVFAPGMFAFSVLIRSVHLRWRKESQGGTTWTH
jgi:hypothetical protein